MIHSEQHRYEKARSALENALSINSDYVPALYNLALLNEELGVWQEARDLLQRILIQEPNHFDALMRLAYSKATEPDDPIISQLNTSLEATSLDNSGRENLHFALGKVYDDCGRYEDAFEHYLKGNERSAERVGPYDRIAHEKMITQISNYFTEDRLSSLQPASDTTQIFICGMFRSGSTLLEQMLAAHPKLSMPCPWA